MPKAWCVTLGEVSAPFEAWCQKHGIRIQVGLRHLVMGFLRSQSQQENLPLMPSNNVRKRMEIRLTDKEWEELQQITQIHGMKPAEWFRACINNAVGHHLGQPEVEVLQAFIEQNRGAYSNLNQIAKHMNRIAKTGELNETIMIAYQNELSPKINALMCNFEVGIKNVNAVIHANQARWAITKRG